MACYHILPSTAWGTLCQESQPHSEVYFDRGVFGTGLLHLYRLCVLGQFEKYRWTQSQIVFVGHREPGRNMCPSVHNPHCGGTDLEDE